MRALVTALLCTVLCAAALARPTILVVQENAPKVEEVDPNQPIAEALARALEDTGKFDGIGYAPNAPIVLAAVEQRRLRTTPEAPTLADALDMALPLKADYVLFVRAVRGDRGLSSNARLFRTVGGKQIWSRAKEEDIQIGGRTDWNAATSNAARTIAMIIASEPLANVPITRAVRDTMRPPQPAGETPANPTTATPTAPGANLPAAPQEPEVDHLRAGLQALQEERALDAVAMLREAVDAQPTNGAARAALARAYALAKMPDEAVDEISRARRLAPNDPTIESAHGRMLLEAGRGDEAIALFAGMAQASPNNPEAQLGLGLAYLTRGLAEQAVPPLTRAVELSPRNWEPAFKLAQAQLLLGRYQESGDLLKRLAALGAPNDPPAQRRRFVELADVVVSAIDANGREIAGLRAELRANPANRNAALPRALALQQRTDGLATFVENLEAPPALSASRNHLIVAAQFLAQAGLALHNAAQSEELEGLDDAALFRADALKAMEQFRAGLRPAPSRPVAETKK